MTEPQIIPAEPVEPVRCGMGLIVLWGLQAMIDKGQITAAEAAELVRQLPAKGATDGSD